MPSTVQTVPVEQIVYNAKGKAELAILKNPNCKATQTFPLYELLKDPNQPLAIDIEFQECKRLDEPKWHHRMGRISLVDTKGNTVYDTYVRYHDEEGLAAKVNPRFGVTWKDLKICNGAKWIETVEADLQRIMTGRTIVGQGMRLDIGAIDKKVWEKVAAVVDTQDLYGQVGLGRLVDRYLKMEDFMWHDPTHDAKATMLLYLRIHAYKERESFNPRFVLKEEDFPALGGS